jgi:hypothetical protein
MDALERRRNTVPPSVEQEVALRQLLGKEDVRISADQARLLRSPLLDVVISLWPSEEREGQFDALIFAFEPGGSHVRLDGVAVHARGQDEVGTLLRFGRVTGRGDLALDGLREGVAYRLHSPAVASKPRERSKDAGAWAALGAEASPSPPRSQVVESTDSAVRGTMRFLCDGTAEVVFETTESRWASAVVRFALVHETGRVEYEDQVSLEYVRDGLWEGQGRQGIRVTAATDFVFEVQPRA